MKRTKKNWYFKLFIKSPAKKRNKVAEYSKKPHEPKPVRTFKLFEGLESAVEKMNTPPVKRGKSGEVSLLSKSKVGYYRVIIINIENSLQITKHLENVQVVSGWFSDEPSEKGCSTSTPIKIKML